MLEMSEFTLTVQQGRAFGLLLCEREIVSWVLRYISRCGMYLVSRFRGSRCAEAGVWIEGPEVDPNNELAPSWGTGQQHHFLF